MKVNTMNPDLTTKVVTAMKRVATYRAYPGSEFVVANTLGKWKKLEPNDIYFSHDFSQKVSTSCFVFNSAHYVC